MDGLAAKVQNAHDGKTYIVSTARNPLTGLWETAIFENGGFLRLHGKLVYAIDYIGLADMEYFLTRRFPRYTMADFTDPEMTIRRPMQFFAFPAIDDTVITKHHEYMVELVGQYSRDVWRAAIREVSAYTFQKLRSFLGAAAGPETAPEAPRSRTQSERRRSR